MEKFNLILVIDNYDSFTYNLVQYIQTVGHEIVVRRNDQFSIEQIKQFAPDYIVLSPGPGNPNTAGICLELVKKFYRDIPILGVCLGHQIIAQALGGTVKKAKVPMHGKTSKIEHDGQSIFYNLPCPTEVARYHSLIVDDATLPDCFDITAKTTEGEIMAIRHKTYKVEGVQFHPEAILTNMGLKMVQNFFIK